jgi:hypothetical protein
MIPRVLAAAFAALLAAGCGGNGKPDVVPAGGQVMFKKTTPAVGALVVFHPVDPALEKQIGGKPFAKVKEDGSFTLTSYAEGDGAPEGEYGVTVDWRGKAKDAKITIGDSGPAGASLLNPKYGIPQQPVFKFSVKKGEANKFTLDVD